MDKAEFISIAPAYYELAVVLALGDTYSSNVRYVLQERDRSRPGGLNAPQLIRWLFVLLRPIHSLVDVMPHLGESFTPLPYPSPRPLLPPATPP